MKVVNTTKTPGLVWFDTRNIHTLPIMKRYLLLLTCLLVSPFVCSQNGESLYRLYCAGCHGNKLEGSTAPALIKENWDHGGDKTALINSIKNGIPGTEMIPWSSVLSENDIESLAEFIAQRQALPMATATDRQTTYVETKHYKLKVEELVTNGWTEPWGIEFVDRNRALVTGRDGELYWVVDDKLDPQKITGLPFVYGYDLYGGLMDLALDPDYHENGWIYLAFSHNSKNSPDKNTPGMTKVVRGRVTNHQWTDQQDLFQVHDSLQVIEGTRWGCRFLFDQEGYLYFTIGDMQASIQSGRDPQILTRPQGKIYRINPDGSIPEDNPLFGEKDVLQAIYCWGTRNVQGLAQHPVNGDIYFSDHGPQGGDELNILIKGANYGWPVITYGVNYDGSVITRETHAVGMEQPLTYWTPSIAVCAIEFVTGDTFPKWQHQPLVTALKFQELRRLVIEEGQVVEQEILLKDYGRVRDVKVGPDDAIYVLTNGPDTLLKITPE